MYILSFPINTWNWKTASLSLGTTEGQIEKDGGVWQNPPIWSYFQILLICLISFLKRISHASGSRQEAGFSRLSECNETKKENRRCFIAPAPAFRKDFDWITPGISEFFFYSNNRKRCVSVIYLWKNILLLNNFCIKKFIIKHTGETTLRLVKRTEMQMVWPNTPEWPLKIWRDISAEEWGS